MSATGPTAASDIFAPVSGSIESINESLGDQPSLLNRSPEDQGDLSVVKSRSPIAAVADFAIMSQAGYAR